MADNKPGATVAPPKTEARPEPDPVRAAVLREREEVAAHLEGAMKDYPNHPVIRKVIKDMAVWVRGRK